MDKNGLPWEENDYVKLNICVQINGLKMQQFWTDSLDDLVCFMFDIVIGFALGLADVVNSKQESTFILENVF